MLFVTTEIKKVHDNHFMGWSHDFKALVVQGSTEDEVKQELLISLRAKVAFDTGLSIANIDAKEVTPESLAKKFQKISDNNTYKTQLA
jgi:hypothetical protein